MPKKKLDKETERIYTTNEHLKSMTESAGWSIAKELLLKKAATLLNLASLGELNPNTLVLQVGIRQETAKALIEWMKEIEGTVSQHKSNLGAYAEVDDKYIVNMEELA